ncbi:MAG: FAD-dependent thymidylate synthase [Marivivens sp.]|nr:FAD-dependent thymidylate synthase [Marivivens sp.]
MSITPEQEAEVAELRATPRQTLRAVSEGMERHLYTIKPVLDHGFVRVVDYMGDDAAICQAARVSYGKGTKSVQNDAGLIRYLMRHWHSTPFEMCEIKLHVKLPVFVARQWIRHRTANVNEYSARYSPANIYTQWYWKVDLHNLFHFLRLRADSHAQYEIRVYADEICKIVADWVPAAYQAFEDYRMGGATLSGKALDCVRRMLKGESVTQENSGMSAGEWREFQAVLEN